MLKYKNLFSMANTCILKDAKVFECFCNAFECIYGILHCVCSVFQYIWNNLSVLGCIYGIFDCI
jgi:hypothetical protein